MIERILDEKVRPQLAAHGGGIKSVGCENGIYRFRLLGQCSGCPSAYLTTESLIKEELLAAVPQLKDVVLVQAVSDSLLEQARLLLKNKHG